MRWPVIGSLLASMRAAVAWIYFGGPILLAWEVEAENLPTMCVPRMLEVHPEPPHRRYIKYGLLTLCIAGILGGTLWYLLRFQAEKKTIDVFLDEVMSGQYQQAYRIWQAGSSYTYSDFLQDWGSNGYYGPVRSYQIVTTHHPKDGSGIIIVVDLSPFKPFPSDSDFEKVRQTKQVRLWVEVHDQKLSYAP